MTHTSDVPAGSSQGFDRHVHTLTEVVADAAQQPLAFEPGSKWSYSNNGIATLGRILEVLYGKPFEQVVDEKIFQPLVMRDTSFWIRNRKSAGWPRFTRTTTELSSPPMPTRCARAGNTPCRRVASIAPRPTYSASTK